MHGLESKGLRKGSVSLVGAVAIGLAATAPAYSLTGALGYGASESGYQLPIVFVISVLPMFCVALAYKHLTDAAPDSGTVFTWGSKAIGPRVGWFGGWALLLSSVLAGVGAAQILVNATAVVIGLDEPALWFQIPVATLFILATTALVARGAEESSRTTIVLTVIQYGGLTLFAAILFLQVFQGDAQPGAADISLDWFNPFAIDGFDALLGGFLVALFIFWGFDASLAMSEETTGTSAQAGRSGVIAMGITVVTYVIFATAALAYAGIDDTIATSLTSEDGIDDVFTSLATGAIGTGGAVVAALIVGISAFSATMSTVMPTARGVLAMATYRALPHRFASVDEATQTPKFTTWTIGLMTLAIFTALSLVSESVVEDSVYSVGIAICTYYVVAAFASVSYFARTAFSSVRTAFGQVILPAIGGTILAVVGVMEAYNMTDPDYGSGGSIAGIGTVFIVGVVTLLLGVPLMVWWNTREPGFFRGETLQREHSGQAPPADQPDPPAPDPSAPGGST
jgi:amino acid transporter